MKKALLGALALLAGVTAIVLVRTVAFRVDEPAALPAAPVEISDRAAERLASAIRFRTISHADSSAFDASAFLGLHRHLQRSFPRVHATLERQAIGYSLLYRWAGADSSLEPFLLLGHLDVVPVEAGTQESWQVPPFEGRVAGGFVWGRGAIDNKATVLGTLEAVEMLIAEGFRPRRTLYLAFGHDEEVGGRNGARNVAAALRSRGVRLAAVIDEGGVIGDGLIAGVDDPVALVGVAEKGFATVDLHARGTGGHSSLPPPETAIGVLSNAIARLEADQMTARLDAGSASRQLFERVGPRFPFGQRAAVANMWLSRPLLIRQLQKAPATNAMIRTTTAVTMFQAGTKDNVLASSARATVNFRILPGDSIATVLDHVRRTIDDPRIEVKLGGAFSAEPSALTNTRSAAFDRIAATVRSIAPGTIVAPYLVVVVTDSRYFAELSDNVFRFLPLQLRPADLARMHGTDERVSVSDYHRAIRLYRQLILSFTGPS